MLSNLDVLCLINLSLVPLSLGSSLSSLATCRRDTLASPTYAPFCSPASILLHLAIGLWVWTVCSCQCPHLCAIHHVSTKYQ